jgi:hypothetical protein
MKRVIMLVLPNAMKRIIMPKGSKDNGGAAEYVFQQLVWTTHYQKIIRVYHHMNRTPSPPSPHLRTTMSLKNPTP